MPLLTKEEYLRQEALRERKYLLEEYVRLHEAYEARLARYEDARVRADARDKDVSVLCGKAYSAAGKIGSYKDYQKWKSRFWKPILERHWKG